MPREAVPRAGFPGIGRGRGTPSHGAAGPGADRWNGRPAAPEARDPDPRQSHRRSYDGWGAFAATRCGGDRSRRRNPSSRPDRLSHAYIPSGRGARSGRLRCAIAQVPGFLPGGARDACGAASAGTGLHDASRRGDRGRGLRRRRHQAGDRGGLHSRAATLRLNPLDLDDRRLRPRRLCARNRGAQGGSDR